MAETKERALQWESVPRGTRASVCRAKDCQQPIYWIERPSKTNANKTVRVPVDCEIAGGSAPDSLSDGLGVNHFQTCAAADEF